MRLQHSFLSAVFVLLLPSLTYAQSKYEPECERLNKMWSSQELKPVSMHYTQVVLERATRGIEYASKMPTNSEFMNYMPNWVLSVGSAWVGLLDSELRVEVQQENLLQQTACLRLDLMLIECKMEEVRKAMNAEIERGSIGGIQVLTSLLQFLNERYRHLARGAVDPSYPDPTWGNRYTFDPPEEEVWCCPKGEVGQECEKKTEQLCLDGEGTAYQTLDQCSWSGCVPPEDTSQSPQLREQQLALCPYNADYVPPFQSGYGCDKETMQTRTVFKSLREEMEALEIIEEEVNEYREAAQEFLGIQTELDSIFGNQTTTPEPPADREHLNAFGCGWNGGYCSDNHSITCTDQETCAKAKAGDCAYTDKVCEMNRIRRCFGDEDCEGAGACVDNPEGLPAARELRGPFSIRKDHLRILTEFLGVRAAEELSREYGDDLKVSPEYGPGETEEQQQRKDDDSNPLEQMFRQSARMTFRIWSRIQGREEAAIFTQAVEPPLEAAEALRPLHDAVSRIARLAKERQGMRGFVLRYAYFLRRTCIYRPCNLILERVIKTALAEACFPYTNGEYLNDDPDKPRWEKCKEEIDTVE